MYEPFLESKMIEAIGWLASFCFAICALPQARLSYKQGHSRGVSPSFMWLWFSGEILMMLYVPLKLGWDWPIMFNLITNALFGLVILRYMYFPRSET